jgi:hypothetical protein
MMIRLYSMSVLGATLLAGCEPSVGSTRDRPSWRIVDSITVPWDESTDSLDVYRVAVRASGGADTLREVLPPWPVFVDDSTLWGLRRATDSAKRVLFRWRGPHRALSTWSLPADVLYGFEDVMISPSGQYLAYVGRENGGPYAAVVAVPGMTTLWRSEEVGGCDCDVDVSHARWVTADSFEIAVVSSANLRGWAVFRGSAAGRRGSTSYQATEPDWHAGAAP